MKFPDRKKTRLSLVRLLIAALVLSVVQSWLLAPRVVESPMSRVFALVRDGGSAGHVPQGIGSAGVPGVQ
ncbi:MAG TPA: hypothetical protein VMT79_11390 [Candidatus Binatia bacterium]|nr:hypothetical protein [Candidatus Binatia bacterium]